jgi:hypothetical protein
MRNAAKFFGILGCAAALTACGNTAEQQNAQTETAEINGSIVEVESLPPDESAATPSDDLANGAVDAPKGNTAY